MRASSAATRQLDPYRAGLELGTALRDLTPEVVFLFSSIHYGGSPELLEGLHDGLAGEAVVVGATGDGFYEASAVGEVGASALGLHSGGRVRWHLATTTGVSVDAAGSLQRCVDDLLSAADGQPLALAVLFADFRADAATLVDVLTTRLVAPAVGGLAGDAYRMERCHVYAGRQVLEDGLAVLGASGDLRFSIHVAGDLVPVGQPGTVTAADGTVMQAINGLSAMQFINDRAGKPLSAADLGISAFRIGRQDDPRQTALRTIRATDPATGSVTLFGAVQTGAQVQFCRASPEYIVEDVRSLCAGMDLEGGDPAAGMVISCAGRKHVLGSRDDDHEVGAVRQGFGRRFPLAGFPSFGEIGPRRHEDGYTRTLFHNMTYILLIFER